VHLHEQHLFKFQNFVGVCLLCNRVLLLLISFLQLGESLIHLKFVDVLLKFEVLDVLELMRLGFVKAGNPLLDLLFKCIFPGVRPLF
jgi:hypothetical protein